MLKRENNFKRSYGFYLEEELYKKLTEEAKKQNRTVSYIINEILRKVLK
jgi:predicted DNA-binding protein